MTLDNLHGFVPYPKTPRLNRDVVVTEKLDGTNAQIVITDNGVGLSLRAGSRNRDLLPGKNTDNYGFAQWCLDNTDELLKLGIGRHFGEWYGRGIGRGYGMTTRRFALFNTHRWAHSPDLPACVEVVPVLASCSLEDVQWWVKALRDEGSLAVPGFMHPEGVIVFHTASLQNYKVLIEGDDIPKGLAAPQYSP